MAWKSRTRVMIIGRLQEKEQLPERVSRFKPSSMEKSVLTAQTADAEAWTDSPVTGPQPLSTHSSAAELMAALFAGLHWQAKSVGPQPTFAAAGLIHVTCVI